MRRESWLRMLLLSLCGSFFASSPAAALTPESPQVQRLINSGLKFLEGENHGGNADKVGGAGLIGLCHFKATGDPAHPQVARAIAACQQICRQKAEFISLDIYSTGIAIMFLCEVDAGKYHSEIQTLLDSLIHRQHPAGAWGYPGRDTCDTSMTQYGALGVWAARRHGFDVPDAVAARACNWLIRTQDPSGGWGYQGNDTGGFRRVPQKLVRLSLTSAGLGSTYIFSDVLDFSRGDDLRIEGLPPAFRRVVDERSRTGRSARVEVPRSLLRRAQAEGNRWLAEHLDFNEDETALYYYMYALERHMSFRELVEGRDPGTAWYDRGIAFLAEQQAKDGSWQEDYGPGVDTAFAVLFLMRGTKKTIEKTVASEREGLLVGGRGLPRDAGRARLLHGRIVATPLSTSIDELLAILEDPQHGDFDDVVEVPAEVTVDPNNARRRAAQVERLKRLAADSDPHVREAAVKVLARCSYLEAAPVLIAALEDDQTRVSLAARDGLRRLSRKFDGFGLPDRPTRAEKTIAADRWRKWYAGISATE